MFYLAAAVSDFFLPQNRVVSISTSFQACLANADLSEIAFICTVRAQNPKREGKLGSRDGSGSESPATVGTGVDTGCLYRLVQGELHQAREAVQLRHQLTRIAYSVVRYTLTSLQLETEEALLIPKARAALTRYGHQLVIGNDLHRRKLEVVLVEPRKVSLSPSAMDTDENDDEGQRDLFEETWLRLGDLKERKVQGGEDLSALEIEELIVEEIVERHDKWISRGAE